MVAHRSPPAGAPLELAIFLGNETKIVPLPADGSISIGRLDENDVRIDDASISRRHAVIHLEKEPWVEDLGSANGTSLQRRDMGANAETDRVAMSRGETFAVGIGDIITFGTVRACIRRQKLQTSDDLGSGDLADEPVVVDPNMKALLLEARRAAQGDLPILLTGETGVGKEVLARFIHRASRQSSGKFVVVHVAAMSESLLEGELFGHEKGAFTGALDSRAGIIESADNGTVLLDELGEIPLGIQVKLLRILEERSITRIGARKPRPINVRFIAATHRDLEAEVARGTFRADLYYRIHGTSFRIPPLRQRKADIPAIARVLLDAACKRLDRENVPVLSDELLRALDAHDWPGNIRELRNVIDRLAVFCEGNIARPEHLPKTLVNKRSVNSADRLAKPTTEVQAPVAADEFRAAVEDLDRRRVLDALAACGGNQSRAAEMLGISRRTLVSRLDAYGLPRPRKPV